MIARDAIRRRVRGERETTWWRAWLRTWGHLGFAAGSEILAREYAAGRNW